MAKVWQFVQIFNQNAKNSSHIAQFKFLYFDAVPQEETFGLLHHCSAVLWCLSVAVVLQNGPLIVLSVTHCPAKLHANPIVALNKEVGVTVAYSVTASTSLYFCLVSLLHVKTQQHHNKVLWVSQRSKNTTTVLSLINAPGALQFFKRGMFIRGKFSMQKCSV